MTHVDERGGPDLPVRCGTCSVEVLVRKNSMAHTVIQWQGPTSECPVLGGTGAPAAGPRPTCEQLRSSIEDGVRAGLVQVLDEQAPPAAG